MNANLVLTLFVRFELVKTSDHPYLVGSATLSPDGTRYVVGGADFYVHVCMFGSGKEIGEKEQPVCIDKRC